MSAWTVLGKTEIPNGGGELTLSQRGEEFSIRLSGVRGELMNSRVHGSEEALAELGCAALTAANNARVLVGGLGMGFTLAAALRTLPASATVVVAELLPAVVEWNRGALGGCAGHPLQDRRTQVQVGDVADCFGAAPGGSNPAAFDAILLDVDNGPEGLTQSDNHRLYSLGGIRTIQHALRANGMLAIWSAFPDNGFAARLKKAGFKVEVRQVRARPGKGSRHTIFLAQKR